MAYKVFAAISVGSVEQELCIYEIRAGKGLKLIDRVSKILPIGNETITKGQISYQSAAALCDILNGFSGIMKSYHADDYKAYATMALRDAKNREIVLDQIRVRTGLTVSVISNSEQRYLNYKALAAGSQSFHDNIKTGTFILDTGHGSLQLSIFDREALVSTENLRIGAAKLSADLMRASLPEEQLLERVRELVDSELINYKKLYLKGQSLSYLFGIGENILFRYWANAEPALMGRELSAEEALSACEAVRRIPITTIETLLGSDRGYARLLPITAVYFEQLIRLTGVKTVCFPGIKFCEGIAADYAEKKGLLKIGHDFEADIISESKNMAKRYRCSMAHAARVEQFALSIADGMRKISGLSKRERLLLQIAAILHGCGNFISIKNADRCAYEIIMATEIIGLSHEERKLIAGAVKYYHTDYDYMTEAGGQTILIAKLTAILKLAAALDRGSKDKIAELKAVLSEKTGKLMLSTSYEGDLTIERLSVEECADFFEEMFGVRPCLKQKQSGSLRLPRI